MTDFSLSAITKGEQLAKAVLEAAAAMTVATVPNAPAIVGLAAEIVALVGNARQELTAYAAEVQRARSKYASDDVEIDDAPLLSVGDDGVWVAAWVWVESTDDEER